MAISRLFADSNRGQEVLVVHFNKMRRSRIYMSISHLLMWPPPPFSLRERASFCDPQFNAPALRPLYGEAGITEPIGTGRNADSAAGKCGLRWGLSDRKCIDFLGTRVGR